MKKGIWASLAGLFTSAGLAVAQQGPPVAPPPDPRLNITSVNPMGMPGIIPITGVADDGKRSPPPTELPMMQMDAGMGIPVQDGPNAFSDDQQAAQKRHSWLPEIQGPGRIWFNADYLHWWVKDMPVTGPLVTSGTGVSQGVPGTPGTTVLYGGSPLVFDSLDGGRWTLGFASDDHAWALEFTGFLLGTGVNSFDVSSDGGGNPLIARPYANILSGGLAPYLVSSPTVFSGSVASRATTKLNGAEVNLFRNVNEAWGANVDFILGFRYLSLEERVGISQVSNAITGVLDYDGSPVFAPGTVGVTDNFSTHNQFMGGQVGAQVEFHPNIFFAQFSGKLGIGNTYEAYSANGQTTLTTPGSSPASVPGGFQALPTSSFASRSAFSLVPEVGINLGLELTCNLRIFAGYTFLYWNDVARAGNQIPLIVNPAQVPASPSFGTGVGPTITSEIHKSDFWAQGINVGFALRY